MTPSVDAFVKACNQTPITDLVRNLHTRVESFEIQGRAFPLTINDGGHAQNCYVCDPTTAYVDYAIEETRSSISNSVLQRCLSGLIQVAKPLVACTGLDRAVHVNNWLFSTNPAPNIDRSFANTLRDRFVDRFPTHAVVLRSLNTHADSDSMKALSDAGFTLLPSRQIYLFEGANARSSRDMKNDQRLLRKTQLQRVVPETREDFERCEALYNMLYVSKYTPLNPQYTAEFLAKMQHAGVLQLEALKEPDGDIVAFGAPFRVGNTLTQPILGYDTQRPKKEGLYRLVTAIAQQHAMDKQLLFNFSAGAAAFKRNRGAVPAVEYSAVYAKHLPLGQRIAISVLEKLLTRIGVPVLQRYEL